LAFKPAPDWEAEQEYFYLATVKPVDSGTSSDIYYQCIGFVNKTGQEVPDWDDIAFGTLYYDLDVVWEVRQVVEAEIVPEWEPDKQTEIGDQVNILENTYKAVCIEYCRKGTGEQPDWPLVEGDTVEDGELVWTCMGPEKLKENLKPQTLHWNEYYKMSIEIELK
jgi:hypothetical protein